MGTRRTRGKGRWINGYGPRASEVECAACESIVTFPQWFSETCGETKRGHQLSAAQVSKLTAVAQMGMLGR